METNKYFDSVKMMRDIRDQISLDIINMDTKQILDYFKSRSLEFETKYGQAVTERMRR